MKRWLQRVLRSPLPSSVLCSCLAPDAWVPRKREGLLRLLEGVHWGVVGEQQCEDCPKAATTQGQPQVSGRLVMFLFPRMLEYKC